MTPTRRLERRLGIAVRRALPAPLAEFVLFELNQGRACLFGGLMLGGLILSDALWRADWPVARHDALLIYAGIATVTLVCRKMLVPPVRSGLATEEPRPPVRPRPEG